MPLPAKLPVKLTADFTDAAVQADLRKYLLEYGTPCEYLGECDAQAMFGHLTAWTALWLCTSHYNFVWSRSPAARAALDRQMSEHRYELFLRRSYVHTNNRTGFELERGLLAKQEADARAAKNETQRRTAARREIREALDAQAIKVGAPDEDLMTGRQRNDIKRASGVPAVGKDPSTAPLSILQLF